jgi:hypothetical protein
MSRSKWFDFIPFPRETQTISVQEFNRLRRLPAEGVLGRRRRLPSSDAAQASVFLHGRAPDWLISETYGIQRWPAERARALGDLL